MKSLIQRFIIQEYFGGIVLVFTALIALIIVNSPWQNLYILLLSQKISFHLGPYGLSKSFLMCVNEGLMSLFFLLVGLELKRELIEGELNTRSKAILPVIGAIGGMLIPSLIFAAFNRHDPLALRGWAIPSATDIAFALAVLSLFSKRIPLSVKIFLTALAILDDLGAIIIIAVFYSKTLSTIALSLAGLCCFTLVVFNRCNITRFLPYALVGFVLWLCVLKSGVHATLAGVVVALAYPLYDKQHTQRNLSHAVEAKLLPWVNYIILPIFAFANAGVPLNRLPSNFLIQTIPLGTILGLFIGKQIGVFGSCWLAVKLKLAALPESMQWKHLYAAALLCGVGFTMSLFIGSLAYEGLSQDYMEMVRASVLIGSTLSAIAGGFFIVTFI